MKPVDIESPIGLDRLATWGEVRCAMSFWSQGPFELIGPCDEFREMDSDLSGRAPKLPEDMMWFEIAREIVDLKSN
jgi:hypothetical protein